MSVDLKEIKLISNTSSIPLSTQLINILDSKEDVEKFWKDQAPEIWIKLMLNIKNELKLNEEIAILEETLDKLYINSTKYLIGKKFSNLVTYFNTMLHISGCENYLPNVKFFIDAHCNKNKGKVRLINSFSFIFQDLITVNENTINEWDPKMDTEMWIRIYKVHKFIINKFYTFWDQFKKNNNNIIEWKFDPTTTYEFKTSGTLEYFLCNRYGDEIYHMLGISKDIFKQKTLPEQHFVNKQHYLCPWLPIISSKQKTQSYIFDNLLWKVLVQITPPVFHNKYHLMDFDQLSDSKIISNFELATWFSYYEDFMYHCYIPQLQNYLKRKTYCSAYEPLDNTSDLKFFYDLINKITDKSKPGVPKYKHQVTNSASDFLLNSDTINQIPYNHVIREQWLMVALIELLKIERETLEFRHWPIINNNLIYMIKYVLYYIADVKQHLLVLLNIHMQLYFQYMYSAPILFDFITKVAEFCKKILHFMFSRELHGIIYDIKYLFFKKSNELNENYISIAENVYDTNNETLDSYTAGFWHVAFWIDINYNPTTDLFKDLKNCLHVTQKKDPFEEQLSVIDQQFKSKKLNDNERIIYEKLKKLNLNVSDTSVHIKDFLINGDYFDDETVNKKLLLKLDTLSNNKEDIQYEIYKELIIISTFHQLLVEIFDQIPSNVENMLCTLVKLSCEIMKKEQEIKIVSICCELIKKTAKLQNMEYYLTSDIDYHLNVFEKMMKTHKENHINLEHFNQPQSLSDFLDPENGSNSLAIPSQSLSLDEDPIETNMAFNKYIDVSIPQIKFDIDLLLKHVELVHKSIYYNSKNTVVKKFWIEIHYIMGCMVGYISHMKHSPANDDKNLHLAIGQIMFSKALIREFCNFYFRSQIDTKDTLETFEVLNLNSLIILCEFLGSRLLKILYWHMGNHQGLTNMIHCILNLPVDPYSLNSGNVFTKKDISKMTSSIFSNGILKFILILLRVATSSFQFPGFTIYKNHYKRNELDNYYVLSELNISIVMMLQVLLRNYTIHDTRVADHQELPVIYNILISEDSRKMSVYYKEFLKLVWFALSAIRVNIGKESIHFNFGDTYFRIDSLLYECFDHYLKNRTEEINKILDIYDPNTNYTLSTVLKVFKNFLMGKLPILHPKTTGLVVATGPILKKEYYTGRKVCTICSKLDFPPIIHHQKYISDASATSKDFEPVFFYFCSKDDKCLNAFLNKRNWNLMKSVSP